jgi:hypothetical protein
MAEHLAILSGPEPPSWCLRPEYVLAGPVFLGGPPSREQVVADTPPPLAKPGLFAGRVLMKLYAVSP